MMRLHRGCREGDEGIWGGADSIQAQQLRSKCTSKGGRAQTSPRACVQPMQSSCLVCWCPAAPVPGKHHMSPHKGCNSRAREEGKHVESGEQAARAGKPQTKPDTLLVGAALGSVQTHCTPAVMACATLCYIFLT